MRNGRHLPVGVVAPMRKRCSKNGPPEAEPTRTSDDVPAHGAEIPQPYQHGVYVEITDASNISVSVTLWQDRFRLQNSHGWVVPYEEEDGAAHFAGAENVHIFAYGQCVLVPHTALRPISIRAYSISLKDLTLSYRSRSASTPTPPLCTSFASTPEERDMVQIVALESFRLAAMEDTGMDAMQAAHHTVRLRETLRNLTDERWGSWVFRPRPANLPSTLGRYMPPASG